MSRILIVFALLCAGLSILTLGSYASPNDEHQGANDSSVQQVNSVVQWNRTLLAIVRTPGAQPATVHPTRSFAILHAAIYDAVNAIDRTHRPYLVRLSGVAQGASQEAAAAAAAHEVLVALYPGFQAALDTALQQSLAQIPDGNAKVQGIRSVRWNYDTLPSHVRRCVRPVWRRRGNRWFRRHWRDWRIHCATGGIQFRQSNWNWGWRCGWRCCRHRSSRPTPSSRCEQNTDLCHRLHAVRSGRNQSNKREGQSNLLDDVRWQIS